MGGRYSFQPVYNDTAHVPLDEFRTHYITKNSLKLSVLGDASWVVGFVLLLKSSVVVHRILLDPLKVLFARI